jgi:hypothetical protein
MRIFAVLGMTALLGLLSSGSEAAGFPVVISATVDYTHNTLTISGQNFGSNPSVTLDALTFPAQMPSSSNQIVANFPSGKAPSSFTPGTYFLTLQFKNQLPAIFAVDVGSSGAVGSTGPAGPAGPPGAPGLPGAQGAPGPAGPAGPQGGLGPAGPTGAQGLQGVAGPAGSAGSAGAMGAQGLQGVAGPQGPAGATGPAGASTVAGMSCPNGNKTPTAQDGVYVDCGDGTIIDTSTGLMWEQMMRCLSPPFYVDDAPDYTNPRCDLNTYSWSGASFESSNIQDGTIFTQFLAQLNLDVALVDTHTGAPPCFANHCDWRVPKEAELATIAQQCASVCPDPAFGPTPLDAAYFSSTTYAGAPDIANIAGYVNGNTAFYFLSTSKSELRSARAVRGSR